VNHAYLHTRRGVTLTPEARAFRDEAILLCRALGAQVPAKGALVLRVWLRLPRTSDDLDNRIKALQDALAEGLGFNDRRIAELHVYRERGNKWANGARVELSWPSVAEV
jgi:Holliday junction resolvase RusA-like endonuclease